VFPHKAGPEFQLARTNQQRQSNDPVMLQAVQSA
jgi:hypothetical protein